MFTVKERQNGLALRVKTQRLVVEIDRATCRRLVPRPRAGDRSFDDFDRRCGFFEVKLNSPVPNAANRTSAKGAGVVLHVAFELCDAAGDNLSSPALTVTAVALDGGAVPAMPPRSDGTFLLSGGHYSYTFHLPKSLAAGIHHLQLSVIGEPTIRILDFDVRKDAVAGDWAPSPGPAHDRTIVSHADRRG